MGFGFNCFGQVVIPPTPPAPDNAYRINGISTAEDIGGVEATGFIDGIRFVNYNNFTVTVIYEAEVSGGRGKRTGTTVLQKGETKDIGLSTNGWGFHSIILIVRKLAE
jgi:hypothetical protein